MKALSARATITSDGTINLSLPSELPPGEAEVVVVVQPISPAASSGDGLPYRSDHGVWAGKLPDADIEADLRGMSQDWETSLESGE